MASGKPTRDVLGGRSAKDLKGQIGSRTSPRLVLGLAGMCWSYLSVTLAAGRTPLQWILLLFFPAALIWSIVMARRLGLSGLYFMGWTGRGLRVMGWMYFGLPRGEGRLAWAAWAFQLIAIVPGLLAFLSLLVRFGL